MVGCVLASIGGFNVIARRDVPHIWNLFAAYRLVPYLASRRFGPVPHADVRTTFAASVGMMEKNSLAVSGFTNSR